MGLLTILKKLKQKEREIRILILGLDNAGKTTILKRVNGEDINDISPTLGFNIKTLAYKSYTLNLWDIGGQAIIRSYWRNYFEQTDALIWVVDSCDRSDRLLICRNELHSLLKEERLSGASLLIFCNKQDLRDALTLQDISTLLNLKDISTHHWSIHACSAKSGDSKGILMGMDWLIEDVGARLYSIE